jgi:integrase/recombinase XerD
MSKKNILTYFTILENRKKKNGMYPVCLVVYFNGTKRRYRTSVELTKEQWKKIKSIKLRDEDLKEKRTEINSFIKKAETVGKKLAEFSFEAFEEEYFKKKQITTENISFSDCSKEFMNVKANEWSIKTYLMYETILSIIDKFQHGLRMKTITPDFLRKFENQLVSGGKSISTTGIYLRQIRTICNYAINKKYLSYEKYPFKTYKVPAAQKNKRALSNEDIKTLIEYKTDKPEEQKAIDFWTFSYLGNGMNFKDITILRYSNIQGDNLKFFRSKIKKTNKGEQKEISIYLLPRMQDIIKRWGNPPRTGKEYIFPILQEGMSERAALAATAQFIKITNKYLECVTEALEWKLKVTTYYARHSFATRLKRAGVPILYISESLGHANTTTTENYLSSFTDDVVKSNAGFLLDL